MKSLGEIHWDIDHQCREENISTSDESMMLFHAAEEYVEELLKHDRWKFIIKSDIESLKVSSFCRREIKGYSHGAELLLSYTIREIERFGYNINDIIDPITHELSQNADVNNSMIQDTAQTEIIPETGNSDGDGDDEDNGQIRLPLALDTQKARDLFTAAYNQGWIEGSEAIGYRWIGFGNIHKRTNRTVSCTNQLAYLCYKIYYPLTPSWSEIDTFFGEKRMDRDWSNVKLYLGDNNRPPWMNTIDHLIINSGY